MDDQDDVAALAQKIADRHSSDYESCPHQERTRRAECDECLADQIADALRAAREQATEGGTTFSVCDECWDRVHNHKFLRHQARPSWDCCMYQTEPGGLACRRPASAHAVQPE